MLWSSGWICFLPFGITIYVLLKMDPQSDSAQEPGSFLVTPRKLGQSELL